MYQTSRSFSLAEVVYPKNPFSFEDFVTFRNKLIFYGEELLAPRPTPKLQDHPLSAVRDCLFSIFAITLHSWKTSAPLAT
jgi:hypothetical protein